VEPPSIDNPLREGLRLERTPEPNIMVIFGASGDLTRRKLIPALYDLARQGLLPGGFSVVGFARRPKSHEQFRAEMRETVAEQHPESEPLQDSVWNSFAQGIYYHQADFQNSQGYEGLRELLAHIDQRRGTDGNRLFYLATPPSFYAEICRQLGAAGLARNPWPVSGHEPGWTRIVVEKPFGRDLATARELNRQVHQVFDEGQVYRIDHYLGKETVQNIMVFRFANGIFEPIWNRRYVDHVQITVAESLGVEGRGSYYEQAGVIRDMIQNHMLQLLTLVAMEPPAAFEADAVRDEKVKVLRAIRPLTPAQVSERTARGQYGPGSLLGQSVPGYREEPGVAPDSTTETFAALKLYVDNWRWAGIPFYLRSGKRLPKRATEIAIHFRQPPLLLFGQSAASAIESNVLALRIQPDEGISLKFDSKVPSPTITVRPVKMDFYYGTSFGVEPPEAYERLLLDCMLGDSTLFTRHDEVELAWSLITSIIEGWRLVPPPQFPNYETGTWGPREAHDLIERDGRRWRRL
jgi:glucose-6-phosphate 1-dehydrogenase